MNSKGGASGFEAGHDDLFARIFKEYWPPLVRHAITKLGSQELAQDVVQEVFVALWKSELLDRPEEIRIFLYGILRYKILDEYRKDTVKMRYANERSNVTEQQYCSPDQLLLNKELKQIIDDEIAGMPERMQEIFRLKKQQNQSISEIALSLGLSEQTVKNQLYKATERLKKRLVAYDSSLVALGILLLGFYITLELSKAARTGIANEYTQMKKINE